MKVVKPTKIQEFRNFNILGTGENTLNIGGGGRNTTLQSIFNSDIEFSQLPILFSRPVIHSLLQK